MNLVYIDSSKLSYEIHNSNEISASEWERESEDQNDNGFEPQFNYDHTSSLINRVHAKFIYSALNNHRQTMDLFMHVCWALLPS